MTDDPELGVRLLLTRAARLRQRCHQKIRGNKLEQARSKAADRSREIARSVDDTATAEAAD
jgi:hypothetical protein